MNLIDKIIRKLRNNGYMAYTETATMRGGQSYTAIFLHGVRLNIEQIRILGGLPPKQHYIVIGG